MDGEKLKLINFIEAAGGLITAAEASQLTGLASEQCERLLIESTLEDGGDLFVGEHGDIVYRFAAGIAGRYLRRSIVGRARELALLFWAFIFSLVKICLTVLSFVAALLLAVLLVVPYLVLFIIVSLIGLLPLGALSSSATSKSEHKLPGPLSIINYFTHNFFGDCSSFLFGDEPKLGSEELAERRADELASLIIKAGGALIVEQVAPFMAPQGKGEAQALPVLLQFNGRAEVSSGGVIVYTFKQFLGENRESNQATSFLLAPRRQFSHLPFRALWKVWMFSAVNFTIFYLLWTYRHGAVLAQYRFAVEIFFYYSCAFIAIPALRFFYNSYQNTFIDVENELREALSEYLKDPDELAGELGERLKARLEFAQGEVSNLISPISSIPSISSSASVTSVTDSSPSDLDGMAEASREAVSPREMAPAVELPSYIDAEHEARIREEERLWKES